MRRILNISIIVAIIGLFFCQISLSQSTILQDITHYEVVKIDHLFSGKKSLDLHTSINLGDYGAYTLELSETDLLAADYSIETASGATVRSEKSPSITTYVGQVSDQPNSVVAITMGDNFIHGFIRTGKSEINIEPMRYYHHDAAADDVMIYLTSSQKKKKTVSCALTGALEEKFNKAIEAAEDSKKDAETCVEIDMAIASDYSMVEFYGDVQAVEYHAIAILNAVQTNYDTEFETEIKFNLVRQYVSDCSSCDPWTKSNDTETLLNSFRKWSRDYWNTEIDQSSLWSRRDFSLKGNNSANGLAWVNTICTNFSSLIVEDNDTGERKRVLFAHELGHNFGAQHDPAGSEYIMASPLVETNQWSPTSLSTINGNYPRFRCLAECEPSELIVAKFSHEYIGSCVPLNVQYTNQSEGDIDSVMWTFAGGTPTFSTEMNPQVQYTAGGNFGVTLQVYGKSKSDIIEFRDLIQVSEVPDATFAFDIQDDNLVTFRVLRPLEDAEYIWDLGDDTILKGSAISHTYESPLNRTVSLSATNACGSDESSSDLNLELIVLPIANFSSEKRIGCTGERLQFFNLSEAADSVTWFFEGGSPNTTNEQNPTVTFTDEGIYAVGLIAINAEGRDSIALAGYIAVDAAPKSKFDYVISEKTVNFLDLSESSRRLRWNFGDGTASEDESPVHTYSAPGTYTVILIADNLCGTDTISQTLTIEAELPIASFISSNQNICLGESVRYEDQSVNAINILWEFEGGTPSISDSPNPEVRYDTPGDYSVKLTVNNDDGTNDIFLEDYIQVKALPKAKYSFISSGKTVSFINSSDNADTYLWDFGDGQSSSDNFASHTFAAGGTYTVSLTAINECGSSEENKQIVIEKLLPVATFTPSTRSTCAGSVVSYINTSSDASSYQWIFEGGIPETSTILSPSVIYSRAGSFDVSLIVSNDEGKDTLSYTKFINIKSAPKVNVNIATEEKILIIENSTLLANSHAWDFGDGRSSTIAEPSHNYEGSGTYTISYSASNECGSSRYSEVIVVQDSIPAIGGTQNVVNDFEVLEAQICVGDFIDLLDLSTDSDSIDWSFKLSDELLYQSFDPDSAVQEPGIYDIRLTIFRGIEIQSIVKEAAIEVSAEVTADFTAVRVGESNTIEFKNFSSGGDSYIWRFGDQIASTTKNPTYSYSSSDRYVVTLIVNGPCGNASIAKIIDLTELSTPQAVFSVSSLQICEGESVRFRSRSVGAANHQWSFEGGDETSSDQPNNEIVYATPGQYTVTYEVSNLNGTDKRTLTNLIKVLAKPNLDFEYTLSDQTADFNFSSDAELTEVNWDFGDGNESSELSPQHIYAEAGDYTVTLSVNAACGVTSVSQNISIISDAIQPTARFKISSLSTSEGGSIRFESISLDAESISWSFEGGDPENSIDQIVRVKYEKAGKYDVSLTAINQYGEHTVNLKDFVTVQTNALESAETRSDFVVEDNDRNLNAEVSVFPNPFYDYINIIIDTPTATTLSIDVYSLTGQSLFSLPAFDKSSGKESVFIDLSGLAPGTYLTHIKGADNTMVQKIVKH